MTIQNEIIYPIFLECCQYTTDIYWKNIFEDLAYGKCSYGTYISKDYFICNYRGKEFNYKIGNTDPETIYKDIYTLLTKKLKLLSERDKVKKRIEFYKIESDLKDSRQTWSNIKKKNLKDLLIEKYVVDTSNMWQFTLAQSKYLMSLLFIAFTFKIIKAKDITYKDGSITEINGLKFKKNKIILDKKLYNVNIEFSNENMGDNRCLSVQWTKYLDNLKKNYKIPNYSSV